MADKALVYLVKHQNADGSWSEPEYRQNTGVTAWCCLALMAEGSQPRVGRYGAEVDRGIGFILTSAQPNGVLRGAEGNPLGPMYEHAYSLLALATACGDTTPNLAVRGALAKAVQLALRSQKSDGGWR